MKNRANRILLPTAAVLASPVWAHEGHGLGGAHWHATDAWGFGLALAVGAAAWWWWRGRK
jgi:hypothetical protein